MNRTGSTGASGSVGAMQCPRPTGARAINGRSHAIETLLLAMEINLPIEQLYRIETLPLLNDDATNK